MNAREGLLDVGLRLLDHQIQGSRAELMGNVDNALLEDVDGVLTLTALVTGPPGLAPRFGGRLGTWMHSIWYRLRPEGDRAPVVIPMTHVRSVASAVVIDEVGQRLVSQGAQLELWLRLHIVGRIPGATSGPSRISGQPLGSEDRTPGQGTVPPGAHLVSELLGARVMATDGRELGSVLDVAVSAPQPGRTRVGSLPVLRILYGRRRLGARMGYTMRPDQGPWLIAAPLRAWHRSNRLVPLADVDVVDWDSHCVVLGGRARPRHPYDDG